MSLSEISLLAENISQLAQELQKEKKQFKDFTHHDLRRFLLSLDGDDFQVSYTLDGDEEYYVYIVSVKSAKLDDYDFGYRFEFGFVAPDDYEDRGPFSFEGYDQMAFQGVSLSDSVDEMCNSDCISDIVLFWFKDMVGLLMHIIANKESHFE